MTKRKLQLSSLVLVVLLALSGLSFGFLVGRSQEAKASQPTEQLHTLGNQVKASTVMVAKGADAVRRLLVK